MIISDNFNFINHWYWNHNFCFENFKMKIVVTHQSNRWWVDEYSPHRLVTHGQTHLPCYSSEHKNFLFIISDIYCEHWQHSIMVLHKSVKWWSESAMRVMKTFDITSVSSVLCWWCVWCLLTHHFTSVIYFTFQRIQKQNCSSLNLCVLWDFSQVGYA